MPRRRSDGVAPKRCGGASVLPAPFGPPIPQCSPAAGLSSRCRRGSSSARRARCARGSLLRNGQRPSFYELRQAYAPAARPRDAERRERPETATATKPMRPSPGSEKDCPTSGGRYEDRPAAVMFTTRRLQQARPAGCAQQPSNEGANGIPAASPTSAAATTTSASGEGDCEQSRSGAPHEEARAQEAGVPVEMAAEADGSACRGRASGAGHAGEAGRLAARALEERHDPVPITIESRTRRCASRQAAGSRRSATRRRPPARADRPRSARSRGGAHRPLRLSRRSRTVPARSPLRNEREREAASTLLRPRNALREWSPDCPPHVVAPGDEGEAGSDSGDRAHEDRNHASPQGRAPRPTPRRST